MGNDAAASVTGGDDYKGLMQQWLDTNGSSYVDFTRTCTGERGIDREEGFVSQFYSTCLEAFQQMCRQEQQRYAPGARSYLLEEELGKLYLWGETFGPGELDKALCESEEIKDNVLDLLVNLGELVIRELRASSTIARPGQIHQLESFIEQTRLIMSAVDGQENLDGLAGDAECLDRDGYSDDDIDDFCEDVAFTIKCLMELGPSLEQNLASARRSDFSIFKSASVLHCPSEPAEFYVSLVREKFRQASEGLVKRLGEANWQRHLKVRNMMEDAKNNPAKVQDTARSTFHDSGIGTSVPVRTQYAPSHTSFRTSNTEGGPRSLRVPPTPLEAAQGKPFQCYLCGDMLSTIRTRTQWKMHVFSDLMPYICTFDGCQHELRSFPNRSSWADHEFQDHRFNRSWLCPECPRESCSTLDWEHHLNDVHNQKLSGPNLVAARNIFCRITPKRAEEEECPLCRVVLGKPRRAFVKHVSRHMEDIALMALPRNADEDSETSSVDTNHALVEDNDTSKDGFGDDNGNTVYSERDDMGDALILGSPEAERPYVLRSVSPDDSPPAERSPTPVGMSKLKERRRRPKARASQGDAVLIGFMGGLDHPDLASKAGEEPLPRESDESGDEDEVGSESGPDALRPLFATASHSKSDTSPREHQAGEEPLPLFNTLHKFQPSQNSASPGHKRTYQACVRQPT